MVKRRKSLIICVMVLSGLMALAGNAWGAEGGVHMLYVKYGIWRTNVLGDTQTYVSLANTKLKSQYIYGARADGGLDQIRYGSGYWQTNPLTIADGYTYVALVGDKGTNYMFYGARVDGGLDRIRYSGGWKHEPMNGESYVALTRDAANSGYVFGARASGGVDRVRYSSSIFDWETISANDDPNLYVTLCTDANSAHTIYGAHEGGGLYCIYWTIANGWQTKHLNDNSYVALVGDLRTTGCVYGARAEGGLDRMIPDVDPNTWQTEELVDANSSYVAITVDANLTDVLYAAHKDGGLDKIYFEDGCWKTDLLNENTYTALIYDAGLVVTNQVYAAGYPACGDMNHPYPTGDVDSDCYVGFMDLAEFAQNWLLCNHPDDPNCGS